MKLREYLELRDPGDEITCWDKDIDSEFYFYTKEEGNKPIYDEDFPNVNKLDDLLKEHLDVVKIRDDGIEVNLYELLENPKIVEYAKKHMLDEHQYEDDGDVALLLFDDNVVNFSQGIEGFSELMANAIEIAFENRPIAVEKDSENLQPNLVTITETYKKTVVVYGEDELDSTQRAVDLCEAGYIEFDEFEFIDRETTYIGIADEEDLRTYPVFDKPEKVVKKTLDSVVNDAEKLKNEGDQKPSVEKELDKER